MPETKLTDFVAIGSIASAVVTVTTAIVTRSIPWGKAKLASRAAKKQIESIFPDNIEEVVRYYVMPEASLDDPSLNLEDNRKGQPRRPKLFKALDDIFASGSSRYSFLLADSGMGKTSALINYYARHIRRWSHPFKIAIVSLSSPNPLQRIEALQSRENTVLFLDAFDEDQAAIKDYREHLNQLIQAPYDFKALLITCRTQFFPSDADIPTETKRRKAGPRPAAEPSQYVFSKLYSCPFSEKDVRSYIRRRYPLWKFTDRHRILALIKRVPKLVHRPMLLAHLDTLARSRRDIECSVDLYEEMIEAWLKRESEVAEIGHMRLFS